MPEKQFSVTGEVEFGPFYPPDRIQFGKERELNRKQNMCDGEDVTDEGEKNMEVHVTGLIRKSEISALLELLNNNKPVDLFTDGWTGEVHVRKGDYEGPTLWDQKHGEWLFEYTLDFVSTGREERDGTGIIAESENYGQYVDNDTYSVGW